MDLADVEVFKAGTHTDSSGHTQEWSLEQLQAIAERYNQQPAESRHVAPLVLGHPEDDAPAYGWVKKLRVQGDRLLADFEQVSDQFIAWLKEGAYRTRSIALYGDLMLRHIGFLGATPPAVKGLADVKLNDGRPTFFYTYTNARDRRSRQYGIAVKEVSHEEIPNRYRALVESDFADPVNFRFPTAPEYIRATIATWSRPAVREVYSHDEQKKIGARILKSALQASIKIDPKKWADKPSQDHSTSHSTEMQSMGFLEALNAMLNEALTRISEAMGEETANQVGAVLTPLIEKLATDLDAQTKPPANEGSEHSQAKPTKTENEIKLEQRVKALEAERLVDSTHKFLEGLIAKGSPINVVKDLAAQVLISAADMPQQLAFSDDKGQKQTLTLRGSLEKLFSELPAIASSREFATEKNASSIPKDGNEVVNLVNQYIEEQRKSGRTLSFSEALSEFRQKI